MTPIRVVRYQCPCESRNNRKRKHLCQICELIDAQMCSIECASQSTRRCTPHRSAPASLDPSANGCIYVVCASQSMHRCALSNVRANQHADVLHIEVPLRVYLVEPSANGCIYVVCASQSMHRCAPSNVRANQHADVLHVTVQLVDVCSGCYTTLEVIACVARVRNDLTLFSP